MVTQQAFDKVKLSVETLYDEHYKMCFKYAKKIVVDHEYAQDVVQEVFLDVHINLKKYDPELGSVKTWLLMFTHRRAVDRVRSEQLRTTCVLDDNFDMEDYGRSPTDMAVSAAVGERVRQYLLNIPALRREGVVMAYWQEQSLREIAAIQKIALGTVKSRMNTTANELREMFLQDPLLTNKPY